MWERRQEMSVMRVYSGARSTLTGLTAMAMDIAYFYTFESQSHSQAYQTTLVAIRKRS